MNFTCPHCGMPQIVTAAAHDAKTVFLDVGPFAERKNQAKYLGLTVDAVRCANAECKKTTILAAAGSYNYQTEILIDNSIFTTRIPYPGLSGKPFPQFVPDEILEDYYEAWSIVGLSPKSSATLARRCLQAMIRGFCNIHEKTLYAEIGKLQKLADDDALPKGVEAETIEAMNALRELGNIGAHMKESGGEILNVDSGEAEALLSLIEMLFSDWYVARGKRAERLSAIVKLAENKK